MSEGKEARTIIVAIDGSAEARNASAYALSLARDLGAKLCALYVMDTHTARSLGLHLIEAIREMNQEGDSVIEGVVQQARQLGVEADGLLVEGKPGEEICKAAAARRADMIVVGAQGKSALAGMVLGSVSEYVIHHAQRPVLVVRGQG